MRMHTVVKIVAVGTSAVLALGGGSAFAADQLRTRDRLKDGSCLTVVKDQLRARDRLKDGSCLS